MREFVYVVALTAAAAVIVVGVAGWSGPAAWIVGGVLGAVVATVALADDGRPVKGKS